MTALPQGAMPFGKLAGVAASQRIAGPFATGAELEALPAQQRVDRMVAFVVVADDVEGWGFVASSTAEASASVRVPDDVTPPAPGRWIRGAISFSEVSLADGKVLIGDANGVAAAKTLSGDVTITREGVAAIGAAKVTAAMLANGAGVAALLTAGLGASAIVDHADVSPVSLLAADADDDQAVLVIAICTETLAGDNAPTFNVGWTADADGLIDELVLAGATAGQVFFGAGLVPATNAIIATLATGGSTTNDAGKFAITILALPTAA